MIVFTAEKNDAKYCKEKLIQKLDWKDKEQLNECTGVKIERKQDWLKLA